MIFKKIFGREEESADRVQTAGSRRPSPPNQPRRDSRESPTARAPHYAIGPVSSGAVATTETLQQRLEQQGEQADRLETAINELKGMVQFTAKSADKARRNQDRQFTEVRSHFTDQTNRLCAEFEGALAQRAAIQVFEALLPALDDLDRVLKGDEGDEDDEGDDGDDGNERPASTDTRARRNDGQGRKTLAIVRRRLAECFGQLGIEPIAIEERATQFDGDLHDGQPFDGEASDVAGLAEGTIVEVISTGYRIGNTLIRPASVVVVGALNN